MCYQYLRIIVFPYSKYQLHQEVLYIDHHWTTHLYVCIFKVGSLQCPTPCTINCLQDMQIATVHFITFTTKHNHITPFFFIFIGFQWITILFSRFKLLITYKALNNLAPSYIYHMSCILHSSMSTMPIIQAIIIAIVIVILMVIVVKRFIIWTSNSVFLRLSAYFKPDPKVVCYFRSDSTQVLLWFELTNIKEDWNFMLRTKRA